MSWLPFLGTPAQSRVPATVTAATRFLATLDSAQKRAVLFAYDDEAQRKRWSNFPAPMVQRAGLSLGSLTAPQREAAMGLLATVLSARGMAKVQAIMEGDEVLKETGGGPGPGGGRGGRGGRGGPPAGGPPGGAPPSGGPPGGGPPGRGPGGLQFGRDLYFVSILGTPSATTPWMLQFGGHHLAVNVTMAGAQGGLTPTLTGVQPATYTRNGATVRPLERESTLAWQLFSSLTPTQKQQAVLPYRVADLVLGPGQDGRTMQPEGLRVSSLSAAQQQQVLDLVAEWSGIVYDGAAAARLAEIKATLADTWFAWSGPQSADDAGNISAYYRIQGPTLVIEYAPQNGDVMHIHTMYRDPTNDYGRKFGGRP